MLIIKKINIQDKKTNPKMVETIRKLLWKHIYVTSGINHCSLHVCKPKTK